MREGKFYPLGFIKSFDLSDRKELATFLLDYFTRTIPGFVLLEAETEWEECSVDLFGKDGAGRPLAIFPMDYCSAPTLDSFSPAMSTIGSSFCNTTDFLYLKINK